MPQWLKTSLIVICAALGYGGWALYSNLPGQLGPSGPAEDMQALSRVAWRAGLIQGSYAGALTLITLAILQWIFERLVQRMDAVVAGLYTLLVALAVQYSLIIPIHWLNGTPNILITLLPGFIIGTLLSALHLWRLNKSMRAFH